MTDVLTKSCEWREVKGDVQAVNLCRKLNYLPSDIQRKETKRFSKFFDSMLLINSKLLKAALESELVDEKSFYWEQILEKMVKVDW